MLDSGDYVRLTEMAMAQADALQLPERQRAARAAGKLYGIGVAAIVEPSVSNMGYISTVLTATAGQGGPEERGHCQRHGRH